MGEVLSPKILVPLLRDDPDFSALASPEQWRQIQLAAIARKVAPLVAFAIRSHASVEQRAWCDEILTQSWARHDACLRQLDWVLGKLEEGGIEVLVLKGPILGRRHFQPPFLRRPSGDIDLAVRDRDLERAAETLSQCGYTPSGTLAEARRTSHHLVMTYPGRQRVELHTRLSHATQGIPVDGFFDRSARHKLPTGRVAGILSPPDELLGLLLHLANDRFASFFHLYEFRKVWGSAPAGLQAEVVANAVRYRFSAALWLTDVAFQVHWSERFLPENAPVPQTWLYRRLDATLLHAMEANIQESPDRLFKFRLKGRWLDLHLSETPGDALRGVALILRVAWREFRIGRWGTVYKSARTQGGENAAARHG